MSEPPNYMLTPRQKRMSSDYEQRQHLSAWFVRQPNIDIDSIESLYGALADSDERKAKALLMLSLRSKLTEVIDFDPLSGHAMPTGIVDYMEVVFKSMQEASHPGETKDRIYQIVSHTMEAVLAILQHTRNKILREHAMLPVHAAREVDSKSVQWLSRLPGRTLRDKIAGKPYIMAVRRISSIDTSENRLLKAFLLRLEYILVIRQNALSAESEKTCEELLVSLQRWLKSEDAAEIGSWGNLPPNNTLLQDKRYRKIWDGWLWLQGIDIETLKDSRRVSSDFLCIIFWETLSLLNHTGRFRIIQQPVSPNYEDFTVSPELHLPIKGYLFPDNSNAALFGKITQMAIDKRIGYIDDYLFGAADLTPGLSFSDLQKGDQFIFEGIETQGVKRAKRLRKGTNKPKLIVFDLASKQIDISMDEEVVTVSIGSGNIVLTQHARRTTQNFPIGIAALKEIPKSILSLITNSPIEYTVAEDDKRSLTRMDFSVIDICSIRPSFTSNNGSQVLLPFRLLQQHWPSKKNGGLAVDCGRTKAIFLRPDIKTISMRSLFSSNTAIPEAYKNSASMFFIRKLCDYIQADRLAYIVPDYSNDFSLECIRKSINFYFEDSIPFPRSITAIFAWQSSKRFMQDQVGNNDFVLVIDTFDGGIAITPVQAIYHKELADLLPETQGIIWERHPTFIEPNGGINLGMIRNMSRDGCKISEELVQLFGFDGLVADAGKISFIHDDNCYHLSPKIRETLNNDLALNIVSKDTVKNCLNSTCRDCRGVKVYILLLEDAIRKPDLANDIYWLGSAWSSIKGCQTLSAWQKLAGDIALWRDHLPKLSIRIVRDGHFENFYLVKDATVTAQRGKTVEIPVKESFILPAGQKQYKFPLLQGDGNKELQYVAFLQSAAFPLKQDTICRLKMTYTYGADDPYELKFVPMKKEFADFKSIRVQWRPAAETETIDAKNLPFPAFPARKSWSDFKNYPKKDGKSLSDLLEWVDEVLRMIDDIATYGRVTGEILGWYHKGYDNIYCFVKDTLIPKSRLRLENEQELPQPGTILSFYKIEREEGKYYAEDVTIAGHQPKTCFLYKKIRFPVLTIWNHGRSLSDSDTPRNFRNIILKRIKNSLSLIEDENMPESLREELFFFLCCLHKDAPDIVKTRLLAAVKEETLLRRYYRNIAFSIGDAELSWQQALLENILNAIDNEPKITSLVLEILSIALWRSDPLIAKLPDKYLVAINQKLYCCLEFDLGDIQVRKKHHRITVLCNHLELLLALIRCRGIDDEKLKMMLAPDGELTKRYVTLVDDISKVVIDNGIELKSRISLQIEKPAMFRHTPDLLYTLRMFLTGESGANTISISGIDEVEK